MHAFTPKTIGISFATITVVLIGGIAFAHHQQTSKSLENTSNHATNTSNVLGDNTTPTTKPTQTDTTTPETPTHAPTPTPDNTTKLATPTTPPPTLPTTPTQTDPTPQPTPPPTPTCDTATELQDQSIFIANYNQGRNNAIQQINQTGYSPPFVSSAAIAAVTPIEHTWQTQASSLKIQWGNDMYAIHCNQSPPTPCGNTDFLCY